MFISLHKDMFANFTNQQLTVIKSTTIGCNFKK
jgi:hypothetical protein